MRRGARTTRIVYRRRVVIRLMTALIAVSLVGCRGAERPMAPDAGRDSVLGEIDRAGLNVILITIDTLRADHVSCYGDSPVDDAEHGPPGGARACDSPTPRARSRSPCPPTPRS